MDAIIAKSAEYRAQIQEQTGRLTHGLRYHSIQLPDGHVLPGLQSLEDLQRRLAVFPLPDRLDGKRVLDIGAWDGWFSFEMERRGAEVVAVDCVPFKTFYEAREMLGSNVSYEILDVAELSPERLGMFDIVLFFGVLYHLRHPLQGLEKVLSVTRETALVESFVLRPDQTGRSGSPFMEFYEVDDLGGQLDNWYGPTTGCLMALCRSAGFARVDFAHEANQRASLICSRQWRHRITPCAPAPLLNVAVNNRDFSVRFHPSKDEYLLCFFQTSESGLNRGDVCVDVDGCGTPALLVVQTGETTWQADCLRPPYLTSGRHEVRLRTRDSDYSNTMDIFVTESTAPLPLTQRDIVPVLLRASYVAPADARFLDFGEVNCYMTCRAERLSAVDFVAVLDGTERPLRSILNTGNGCWQAKVASPAAMSPGAHTIQLRTNSGRCVEVQFEVSEYQT
jgi:tRNA (mo5U34)-methyltransferase